MPITDLLSEGLKLMLLGMGIVFAFLLALVLAMLGMSRLARALAPEEFRTAGVSSQDPPSARSDSDARLIAAIGAAVQRYRTTARSRTR